MQRLNGRDKEVKSDQLLLGQDIVYDIGVNLKYWYRLLPYTNLSTIKNEINGQKWWSLYKCELDIRLCQVVILLCQSSSLGG